MNEQRFQVLQKQAPLIQGGHPISYITVPQNSILNPYNDKSYFFPEVKMPLGQYKNLGNGFYATKHAENQIDKTTGKFTIKDFQIGVRIMNV